MARGVVWRVMPAPVGRFRSFETRGWPVGEDINGQYLGYMLNMELTTPHMPLRIKHMGR